jgi:isopropylmalate/homocitrate/citramalate synthase
MTVEPLSPYNQPLTRVGAPIAVKLREITLRQIGHMEVEFSPPEKVYFLRRLATAGVAEAIVWGSDEDAEDLVRRTQDAGVPIGVGYYGKTFFPDEATRTIEKAAKAGAAFVCFNGRGSAMALEESGWTRDRMIDTSVDIVGQAKDAGVAISIGLYGFTQTTSDFIQEFAGRVSDAGADRIYCPDSLGVASPEAMREIIGHIRSVSDVPIEAHCHNDVGMGLANTIACVEAGADYVECVVNGMDPERCGIASLDEVAVALEKLYGVDTGIHLEELTGLARTHVDMTGLPLAANKPIVGPRAFNYRVASGSGDAEARKDNFYGSARVVPFNPADVGNARRFMLGKYSGANEVCRALEDAGFDRPDDAGLSVLVSLVRALGTRTRSTVSDEQLAHLLDVVS